MPAAITHLTNKKLNLSSLLAKWKDGLFYAAALIRVDRNTRRCLVCFEDGSEIWLTNEDLHLQLASDQLNSDDDIVCSVCDEGSSDPPNEIIICDICQQGYHQECHNPPVDSSKIDESDTEDHKDWFCSTCSYILNQTTDDNAPAKSSEAKTNNCKKHAQPEKEKLTHQKQTINNDSKKQEQTKPKLQQEKQTASESKSQTQTTPIPKPQHIVHENQKQVPSGHIVSKEVKFVDCATANGNGKDDRKTFIKPVSQHAELPPPVKKICTNNGIVTASNGDKPDAIVKASEHKEIMDSAQLRHSNKREVGLIHPISALIAKESSAASSTPKQKYISNNVSFEQPSLSSTTITTQVTPNETVPSSAFTTTPSTTPVNNALIVGGSVGRTKQDVVDQSNKQRDTGSIRTTASSSPLTVKRAVRKSSVNFVLPQNKQSALPIATRSIPSSDTSIGMLHGRLMSEKDGIERSNGNDKV